MSMSSDIVWASASFSSKLALAQGRGLARGFGAAGPRYRHGVGHGGAKHRRLAVAARLLQALALALLGQCLRIGLQLVAQAGQFFE
jgi:hypothetical protein